MANFIVEYAGAPVRFGCVLADIELVPKAKASWFASEADAWKAVHRAELNPRWCHVVNLYEKNLNHRGTEARRIN